MLRKLILILLLTMVFVNFQAQDKRNVLTIGDEVYSIDEFDFIYSKNNNLSKEKQSKKDYVNLFVNYKLKVKEAKAQGLDTLQSFKDEYEYYVNELKKPYLSDLQITETLMKEAYERLKTEVKASHILIRLPHNASPQDTLKAYNKAIKIIDEFKGGAKFADLAFKYSEDPSAKKNKGSLGYFRGFNMVYPFESAVYNAEVGELAPLTKTKFGYHIILKEDERPALPNLRTAHIMFMFTPNSNEQMKNTLRAKADSVLNLVKGGLEFNEAAHKYSEDKSSSVRGGELPWFNSSQMIPEFSEPAYALENIGDVSEVVTTPYGYHIIKLLERKELESFEDKKDEIKNRISRDERAFKGKESLLNKLKIEYHYKPNKEEIDILNNKVFSMESNVSEIVEKLNEKEIIVASFDNFSVNTKDIAKYIKSKSFFDKNYLVTNSNKVINDCIDDKLYDYEKNHLRAKYDKFRFLSNEYHDGLLIFEISKKEIWDKASADTTGLENYYNTNKQKYFSPTIIDGYLLKSNNKKHLNLIKKQYNVNNLVNVDSLAKSLQNIVVIKDNFNFSENSKSFNKVSKQKNKEYNYKLILGAKKMGELLPFEKCKGTVMSDYQTFIEEQWLNSLKKKYNPVVNLKALKYSSRNKK